MAVMTSLFTLDGYTFPNGFNMVRRDIATSVPSISLLKVDGAYFLRSYMAGKTVGLSGVIGGTGSVDSLGNPIQNLDDVAAEINRIYAVLDGRTYHSFGAGYADGRKLQVQKSKIEIKPFEGTWRQAVQVDIELFANDPRWLGIARSAHFDSSGNWSSGDGGAGAAPALIVNGTAPTYPIFTFSGAISTVGTEFKVGVSTNTRWRPWYNAGLGHAGEITFETKGPGDILLTAGHTLVVDCNPWNRANAFQLDGDPIAGYHLVGPRMALVNGYMSDEFLPFFPPIQTFAGVDLSGSGLEVGPLGIITQALPATGFDIAWTEAWAL